MRVLDAGLKPRRVWSGDGARVYWLDPHGLGPPDLKIEEEGRYITLRYEDETKEWAVLGERP